MLVPLFLTMAPGWDRPFVSTKYPDSAAVNPEWSVFSVEVELPGFEKIDGVIRAVATPVDQPGIRLPDPAKPV